jgi:hypothetical protein
MRKLALSIAAVAALAFSAPAFTAPAFAQDVKVKVKSGDEGMRKKVVIKHRGDFERRKVVIRRGGDVERRKVVIRSGDRGHHYGWRNREAGNKTVVIKKRGGEGMSRTVIKKKTVID